MRTRFAPSPTGVLHLGSVRTALFCWLFARGSGGQFVLRIEDTDRERSTAESVDAIFDGLAWLGLDWDDGPYFQTERFARYREVIADWLAVGKAYRCYCTREELDEMRAAQMERGAKTRYDGRCRARQQPRDGVQPVVRFRNPDAGEVVFDDLVKGEIRIRNSELDDLIIARSDETPTYNFTVVVDDNDMKISHVIRGDDHVNNTPRQLNMLDALGAERPLYAHLPMILGADGARLSKRHGAVNIVDYRDEGYLAEAMLNYLARLGWSHGDQEIFSVDELIQLFKIEDVNASAASFNPEKLRWLNQQHIMRMPTAELAPLLATQFDGMGVDVSSGAELDHVVNGFRERAETVREMAESALYCYVDFDEIDATAAKKHLRPVIHKPLMGMLAALTNLENWNAASLAGAINEVAEDFELTMGKLGQPLRVAITGGTISPPIDVTLELVGRGRTLQRVSQAIAVVEARMAKNLP